MSEIVKKFIADRFDGKEGFSVNPDNIGDSREFAQELGSFLYQLHHLPTKEAGAPNFGNAFAGSDLIFFEAEMIELLKLYQKVVPADLLQEKFDFAAKTKWTKAPVWVLGELIPQNLIVSDGKLVNVKITDKAVSGDSAYDLAIAWTIFDEKSRKIFFASAEADQATIDRARMFALRQALRNYQSQDIDELIQSRDASTEILKDLNYSLGQDLY